MRTILLAVAVAVAFLSPSIGQQPQASSSQEMMPEEINTILMETTFMIQGPSLTADQEDDERVTEGTCFVMSIRLKPDASAATDVIVTAKHVLANIRGDEATVLLRQRNLNGAAVQMPFRLKIRDKGKNLYTEHPTVDVAAIAVNFPANSTIAQLGAKHVTGLSWLATDDFLKNIAIHPGDELLCLGFPWGVGANETGYPILRSGRLASYPIIPLKEAPPILYDFRVAPGDSGGPVYFAYPNRISKSKPSTPGTVVTYQKIFGIVVQRANPVGNKDLSLGVIVPSVYIKETLDRLTGFESKIAEN